MSRKLDQKIISNNDMNTFDNERLDVVFPQMPDIATTATPMNKISHQPPWNPLLPTPQPLPSLPNESGNKEPSAKLLKLTRLEQKNSNLANVEINEMTSF